MLYDTHVHTAFSYDSQMTLAEVQKKMLDINIGVIITEHIDLNYPDPAAFKLDVRQYFAEYEPYRSERLLIGVEIGMGPDDLPAYRRMTEEYPFDYVLASMHVVDHIDIYEEIFYRSGTKREIYAKYFAAILECLQVYDCYDSLGHIDYIARYARFSDREIYYHEFYDYIDPILAILAAKGKCLEINTRRLGDTKAAANLLPLYKRFWELGGRWVTFGSDAHKPGEIGKDFAAATHMAEYCKLRPVWFKRRQIQYI